MNFFRDKDPIPEGAEELEGEDRERYEQVVSEVEGFLGREFDETPTTYRKEDIDRMAGGEFYSSIPAVVVYGQVSGERELSHELAHGLQLQEFEDHLFLPIPVEHRNKDSIGLPKYHREGFAFWTHQKLYPTDNVIEPGGSLGQNNPHALGKAFFDSYEAINGEEETIEMGFQPSKKSDTENILEVLREGPVEIRDSHGEVEKYLDSYWGSGVNPDMAFELTYSWRRGQDGEINGTLSGFTQPTGGTLGWGM